MLPDVDISYLFMDEDKEQGMGPNDEEKPVNLDVFKKNITQQFTFFCNEALSGAQRVLSCLDNEAEAFIDAMDDTYHSSELSPFAKLSPELQEEHRQVLLDSYKELLDRYQTIYIKVQDLERDYLREKNKRSATWLKSTVGSYLGYETIDRIHEIRFIDGLLSQLVNPLEDEEAILNEQSFEWLNENIKLIQKAQLILEGACMYIHDCIQQEYANKIPPSILFELLSSTIQELDDDQKSTALNFLLEQSKNNNISLLKALLEMQKSQGAVENKKEAFKNFKQQCKTFIIGYKTEKLEDYDLAIVDSDSETSSDLSFVDDDAETASNLSM